LVITHTAQETKDVASKISTNLIKHFKDEGHIDSSKSIEKILFSKFTNSKRITYLLSLTEKCSSTMLDFTDIEKVEFSPDTDNPLPQGLDWMEEKIKDLKLNGNALHQTFFFKDRKHHDFLHLYTLSAKFNFNVKGLTGTCVMSLGFPDYYGRSKNLQAEMEVTIGAMAFEPFRKGVRKSDIKKVLLREIENQKITNFKRYGSHQEETIK
jgi:hypothetical protein